MMENESLVLSGDLMAGLVRDALSSDSRGNELEVPSWFREETFPFEIGPFVARGGSGCVWQARHRVTGEKVALKVIPFRGDPLLTRERWFREAEVAATVEHRHLMGIMDRGLAPDESAGWLALEWIEGMSLREMLEKEGRLSWGFVGPLIPQICEGLAALHKKDLIHRDIKSANLLWDEDAERVVIADFGVALPMFEERLTRSVEVVFSPGYTAPEQSRSGAHPDPRSDQFALAATLWELLSGGLPVGSFHALEGDAPSWVAGALRRGLSPKPEGRYCDISKFQHALTGQWRGKRWMIGAAAIVGLFVVSAAVFQAISGEEKERPVIEVLGPRNFRSGVIPIEDTASGTMEVDLTLHSDGRVVALVTTATSDRWFGLSGQASFIFRDVNGAAVHLSTTPDFGVNGSMVMGMPSRRTDTVIDQIPADLMRAIMQVDYRAHRADFEASSRWQVAFGGVLRDLEKLGGVMTKGKLGKPLDDGYEEE